MTQPTPQLENQSIQLPLSPIHIVRGPVEVPPAAILYISWEQEPRYRPRAEIEDAMIVKGRSGENIPFSQYLCVILDALFAEWRDMDRSDVDSFARGSIKTAEQAVMEIKHAYIRFISSTAEAMLIARATELFLNSVRSVDALLDALLCFQLQPERTVSDIKRRSAVLDRSLAGMVSLRVVEKGTIERVENYEKHSDGEVTPRIIAQMFRVDEKSIEQKEADLLKKMRSSMRRARVMDAEGEEDEY